jgi:antitoxin component YwqK of YwqJK toxin-antitoxin module
MWFPYIENDVSRISFYKNGQIRTRETLENRKRNGLTEIFYENGKLGFHLMFKDDELYGECKEWHPNGIMRAHNNVTNDTTAFYKEWNELEVLVLDCKFIDDVREKSCRYYPNGQIEYVDYYINRESEGVCEHYYENGQLKRRANYHRNTVNGMIEKYYDNGRLKLRSYCRDGIPYKSESWTIDGLKKTD